jgi:hypothetical protein
VAPILRSIRKGLPTQLNTVVIQAECAMNCGGADTTKTCN